MHTTLLFSCCYSVIACLYYCLCVTVVILLFVFSSRLLPVAKGGKLSHNYRDEPWRWCLNYEGCFNTLVIISLFNLVFSSQKFCFISTVCLKKQHLTIWQWVPFLIKLISDVGMTTKSTKVRPGLYETYFLIRVVRMRSRFVAVQIQSKWN